MQAAEGSLKKNRHALPKDANQALEILQKRKERLDALDPEKREKKEEKERWEKVMLKAEGEKVRDDEKRLKKMAKRQEREKRKSAKAWCVLCRLAALSRDLTNPARTGPTVRRLSRRPSPTRSPSATPTSLLAQRRSRTRRWVSRTRRAAARRRSRRAAARRGARAGPASREAVGRRSRAARRSLCHYCSLQHPPRGSTPAHRPGKHGRAFTGLVVRRPPPDHSRILVHSGELDRHRLVNEPLVVCRYSKDYNRCREPTGAEKEGEDEVSIEMATIAGAQRRMSGPVRRWQSPSPIRRSRGLQGRG